MCGFWGSLVGVFLFGRMVIVGSSWLGCVVGEVCIWWWGLEWVFGCLGVLVGSFCGYGFCLGYLFWFLGGVIFCFGLVFCRSGVFLWVVGMVFCLGCVGGCGLVWELCGFLCVFFVWVVFWSCWIFVVC